MMNDTPFSQFRYKRQNFQKKIITHNNIPALLVKTISYDSYKPNIVFVHGLGCSWNFWMENIKELNEKFNIYVFDLPWSGLDSCPFSSLDQLVDWFIQIFNMAGIEKSNIIAHSFGATVILNMVKKQLRSVNKLILCSTVWPPCINNDAGNNRRHDFLANYKEFIYNGIIASIGDKKDPEIISNMYEKVLLNISQKTIFDYSNLLYISDDERISPEDIDIPVLIMSGNEDRIVPITDSLFLSQKMKSAKFKCFEGIGHFPMIEKRREFCNEVYEFCS